MPYLFAKKNGVLQPKLCPLYGYTYIPDDSQELLESSQVTSLPLEDLLWMRNIAEILDCNDHKLSEEHLLKRLFDQRWLSEENCFRPASFKVLCEELQNLLGKFAKKILAIAIDCNVNYYTETERMWLGLISAKPGDAEEGDPQIHLILIGQTGVGKTSVRKHLKDEPIDMNESPTIVMEPEFLYRESIELGNPFKHIKENVKCVKCQ